MNFQAAIALAQRLSRSQCFQPGTRGEGLAALLVLLVLFWPGCGVPTSRAEELKTESRMPFLHHIPLRDAEGQIISLPPAFDEQGKPQEARANPFSTAQTCGRCHEYASITR